MNYNLLFNFRYRLKRGRGFVPNIPCQEVDPYQQNDPESSVACAFELNNLPNINIDSNTDHLVQSLSPPPMYVRVSSPASYTPLPKDSSVVYVAPPIIKSADAIITRHHSSNSERDSDFMVMNFMPIFIFLSTY